MVREADTEDKNEIRAIVDSALDIIRQLGKGGSPNRARDGPEGNIPGSSAVVH